MGKHQTNPLIDTNSTCHLLLLDLLSQTLFGPISINSLSNPMVSMALKSSQDNFSIDAQSVST